MIKLFQLRLINPSLGGVNSQLGGVGPGRNLATILEESSEQLSEDLTELALRRRD